MLPHVTFEVFFILGRYERARNIICFLFVGYISSAVFIFSQTRFVYFYVLQYPTSPATTGLYQYMVGVNRPHRSFSARHIEASLIVNLTLKYVVGRHKFHREGEVSVEQLMPVSRVELLLHQRVNVLNTSSVVTNIRSMCLCMSVHVVFTGMTFLSTFWRRRDLIKYE